MSNLKYEITMKTTDLIRKEANKYLRYKDMLPTIPLCEIARFRHDVENAYSRITGIEVKFVDYDPYTCLAEMVTDIQANGKMEVSTLNNNSDLLPRELNLKFRAVHDWLHYTFNQPFDFKGELNVYKCQKYHHTSDIGKRILYSEIVLQAAYATYYGAFPETQKVII